LILKRRPSGFKKTKESGSSDGPAKVGREHTSKEPDPTVRGGKTTRQRGKLGSSGKERELKGRKGHTAGGREKKKKGTWTEEVVRGEALVTAGDEKALGGLKGWSLHITKGKRKGRGENEANTTTNGKAEQTMSGGKKGKGGKKERNPARLEETCEPSTVGKVGSR